MADTGLLSALIDPYETESGDVIDIDVVPDPEAFSRARESAADLIFAHDPEAFQALQAAGRAEAYVSFAETEYVIAGPPGDPAGVRAAVTIEDALRRLSETQSSFYSRGDNSATHRREQLAWRAIGIEPEGTWYRRSEQGMRATLTLADEAGAYVFTDAASLRVEKAELEHIVELPQNPGVRPGDVALAPTFYLAIVVRGSPRAKEARRFLEYLASADTRRLVGAYSAGGAAEVFRPTDLEVVELAR